MTIDELKQTVVRHYLDSRDFNGLPVRSIELPPEERLRAVEELVRQGAISINYGDRHPNPHIHAFPPEEPEIQIGKLTSPAFEEACLYPTKETLATVVTADVHSDAPFSRMLALGEAQLAFRVFDLAVLEVYRNDPRFAYRVDDVQGSIVIRDDFYASESMPERDKILLEHFGFAHNKAVTRRFVAGFIRDLSKLSPEHQRRWETHMVEGEEVYLHPDYARAVGGEWPEGIPILEALVQNMHEINEITRRIGRPPLFREEYDGERRPAELTFLLRPTLREFNAFIQLLDKVLSDNINKEFFQDEVPLEETRARADGTTEAIQKGTLRLLEEWVRSRYHPEKPEALDRLFAALREVRKLRQKPAHATQDDVFDMKYFQEQRALVERVYEAIVGLRLILQLHPMAKGYEPPEYLTTAPVWTF